MHAEFISARHQIPEDQKVDDMDGIHVMRIVNTYEEKV